MTIFSKDQCLRFALHQQKLRIFALLQKNIDKGFAMVSKYTVIWILFDLRSKKYI
ncbi:MAG: hypothetical protein RLZZ04_54 [Cyanobacteriota bacterium]|jgi:hypothetical protein